jgi:hypothetical protein
MTSVGSWVLSVPCPSFYPGAIATIGQTVTIGGTPVTINSIQNATGNGTISYQWYKNGNAISGATAATYTPPTSDANTAGAITYTRRAKDNACNTTLTPSAGSWVLTVTCPSFNPGAIATDGQTILVDGTPATINSVQNATGDGTISYQWYKNGNAISGATSVNYTPPKSDAYTAGVYTYTRRAKDNLCNTTLTPSTGSWVLTVTPCVFNAGAIATGDQTICSGSPVTIIPNSASAYGGSGNITYQWRRNGTAISSTGAAAYNPSAHNTTIGVHTFTRWARDGVCATDWTQSAGQWVLTVNTTPKISLISGSANQTIPQNTAITPIMYAASDATGISRSGSLPAGVTGSVSGLLYTIQGTPSVTGHFNYTVTTTNSYGCTNATASGQIVVRPATSIGGPTTAYTTTTWIIGSQTWSDRIVSSSYCTRTDNLSWNYLTEYKVYNGRYYYSWTCVYRFRNSFCPSPWHVPTASDFVILAGNISYLTLIDEWGYGGYADASSMYLVSSEAYYWSDTETEYGYQGRALVYNGTSLSTPWWDKEDGLQLRCVK